MCQAQQKQVRKGRSMDIVYEDKRIVVAVKPAGVVSVDQPGGMPALLRQTLHTACIRTVHRLDAPVAGLMVFARSAYAAGELKHGTISLIEEGTPVIAAATYMPLFDKAMSNVVEVQARGAHVLALTTESGAERMHSRVERVLTVPETETMLLPQLGVVPLQLLAYYIALERGCDIDKPRNLAKSVTVE